MSEPLTKDIEMGDADVLTLAGVTIPPEPKLKGPLKPVAEITLKERIAGGIAGFATITSVVAIILVQGSVIVFVAGVLSILMGGYAYIQQTTLTDIATLQETTQVVQKEVNRLEEENERLAHNLGDLEQTIDHLYDVENVLEVISASCGQSVQAFEDQLEQNRNMLAKMRENTKGRVLQNLISIIYRGDTDCDDLIGEHEVEAVIRGLQRIAGVNVYEDRLKNAIVGKSIDGVVEVCRNLLRDDVPEQERIFEVHTDA